MPAKVIVGNLSPDTTADHLQELLEEAGAEGEVLSIEGDGDARIAVIELDMDQTTAQILADRSKGRRFRGRTITVYAPRFMK